MRNEPTGMEGVYPAEPGAARTGQLRGPGEAEPYHGGLDRHDLHPAADAVHQRAARATYISVRPERNSYNIIKESGEFVVNLPTESLVRAIDWCGVKSGRDVDKFAAMHLTAVPAAKVGTVLVEESPVNLECKVTQVIPLGSHDLFLAECVAVDVDERLLDESGKLCLNKAKLIVYSHGDYLALGRKLGSFGYSVRKKKKIVKK